MKEHTQRHHPLPKKSQKDTIGTVFDDRTLPEEKELHNKITHQILHEGVPPAYTIGEIDVDDLERGRYPRVKDYKKR